MKKMMYIWITIIIILVLSLTIIGLNLNSKNKKYYDLEEKIEEATKVYLGQYPDEFPSDTLYMTSERLITTSFLDNLNLSDEKCKGYVVVKKVYMYYEYKPFIKCDKYTTNKFNDKIVGED